MSGLTNTSEWITIKQAARITGQSVRTWLWQRTEARQISIVPLLAVGQNEPYTPIDIVQRDRVRDLLDHIHLDRDALTALNLTNTQAENILSGARTWCENNLSTLKTLQDNIHIKVAAV